MVLVFVCCVCGVCFFTTCLILRGFGDCVVLLVLHGAEFAGDFGRLVVCVMVV